MNNQILDYKAILDWCEDKMMSNKFFVTCKGSMIRVEHFETEKWYEGGDTVPVTQSSHHLVPLSSSRIGPKLTGEDESYFYIQSISLCDLCIPLVLVCWMVSLAEIAAGDVINIDFMHPHGP